MFENKVAKKAVWTGVIVYAIMFALINLVIFAIFKPANLETNDMKVVFWFAYGFMALAFVLQIAALVTGRYENGMQSVFFGLPMIRVSLLYFIFTGVLSVAFMILLSFGVKVPFMLMFVPEVILLGLYAIAFIVSLTHRNVVVAIDRKIKQNVFAIRSLVSDVEDIADTVTDASLKQKLSRLAEDIRYSDPMTDQSVAAYDAQIKDSVDTLARLVGAGELDRAAAQITLTQNLISKRNRRLADGK